nr:hypothetical protein [Tanacetum cinerariifolium]
NHLFLLTKDCPTELSAVGDVRPNHI